MSKVKSNFIKSKTFFQNSVSKTKGLFSQFRKFSLATKSVIITGIILSTIGLLASVLIIGSFIFYKLEEGKRQDTNNKEIEKVVNFETCRESYKFETKIVQKAKESENFEFASCSGFGKDFYVKYKKYDSFEYHRHQILNKTDFENEVKLAQNGQISPPSNLPKIPDFSESSSGLIGGNPNSNLNLRNFSQDFQTDFKEVDQKAKIDAVDQKITTPLPRPTFTKYTYKPKNSSFQTDFWNNRNFNRVQIGRIS